MTAKKLLGAALVLLVLTLPVEMALALSGISSISATGKDNVPDAVKPRDQLTVTAEVSIDGEAEITPDQVWYNVNMFDSCIPNGATTLCAYKLPRTGDAAWPERTTYTIGLYRDNPTGINGQLRPDAAYLVQQRSGAVFMDDQRPSLTLTLDRMRVGTIITATAEVSDLPEGCSGVKALTFSSAAGEQIFDYAPHSCSVRQSATLDVSSLAERDYVLTVTAVDYLGNSQSSTATFTVDKTAGNFREFQVKDFSGNEVRHVGRDPVEARVLIKASSDVLSVTADLSQLTKNPANTDEPGQCQTQADGLHCEWLATISPEAVGISTVTFKAEDQYGNAGSTPLQKLIERDTDGPLATKLTTSLSSIAPHYLRRDNNTITVIFSESGSGLRKEDVKLDLRSLGGPVDLAAARCSPSWECVWEPLNFQMPDGRYSIGVSYAPDRLGNPLRNTFAEQVILDTQAPVVLETRARSVGGATIFDGYAVAGDSIEVIAKLSEATRVEEAYADFSAFIRDRTFAAADSCELIDGIWECKWIEGPIDRSGFIDDKVRLTFVDTLQNRRTAEASLTVYGLDNATRNLWTSSVECSPSKIDRQVASLIGQKVICHVKLQGSATLIQTQLEPCTGDISYLNRAELFNALTQDPYIRLTLNEVELQNRTLKLTCPIKILSKSGNAVVTTPEIEQVPIQLKVYKASLDDYGKSVKNKIELAKEDATGSIWEIIGSLRKIISFAEKICSLIRTLNNISTLWNVIGAVFRGTADTLYAVPGAQGAAAAAEKKGQADQTIAQVINERIKGDFFGLGKSDAINKFCKFISCNIFADELGIGSGIGDWQRSVLQYANNVATGGKLGGKLGLGGQGINAYTYESEKSNQGSVTRQAVIQGGRLNPKDSLVLSMLTVCIPGIVHNLDKYRQIQCMYADCLQSSADAGVPLHACEDAKAYETCKYVYGEVFQLLPFAGLFDYMIGLVKNVLYNPLSVADVIIGYQCLQPINTPGMGSVAQLCLIKETLGILSEVINDLSSIKDGWDIQTDYCARIDD